MSNSSPARPDSDRDAAPWVLLVDDDPQVCALGRKVLARAGYRVATAGGGVSLGVLDVRMSGAEVLRRLAEADPRRGCCCGAATPAPPPRPARAATPR